MAFRDFFRYNPIMVLFFAIIGMWAVAMYYMYSLVESAQEENRIRIDENQADEDTEVQRAQEQNRLAIKQNQYLIEHEENATELITDLIHRANVAGNQSEARFHNILTTINDTMTDILEQDAELSQARQENLIIILERGIPQLLNTSERIINASDKMLNFTRFISESFDEEYLKDEVRQYGQSNFTESQIPIIQEKLDRLLANDSIS